MKTAEFVHEIEYRSSGSNGPRNLVLHVSTVRYRATGGSEPTFLVTGDLQGREIGVSNRLVAELVADDIVALQQLGEIPPIDFCFLCGDFYDYPDLRKLGGTGDVTSALNAMSQTADLTFAVLGNHDKVSREDLVPTVRILDGDTIKTNSVTVSGVSGIVGDPKRNNRKIEAEFLQSVARCSTSRTDILLLHQGPEGLNPPANGLKTLNQLLRKRANLLVFFGHCHWEEPFRSDGRNLFCNVDARVLIFPPEKS